MFGASQFLMLQMKSAVCLLLVDRHTSVHLIEAENEVLNGELAIVVTV